VKTLRWLIVLGIVAGWGASRLMGSRGCVVEERLKAKAEQIKGRVEQAVGKATGSEESQARGVVDEASGKAREMVVDAEGEVMKVGDVARQKIAEIKAYSRVAIEDANA
jgi:uncharacterized protein YjbJ (UPF0337 family)